MFETLPKPILTMIISHSFRNRGVCRRWRDAVEYSFKPSDFDRICARGTVSVMRMFLLSKEAPHCNGIEMACEAGNNSVAIFLAERNQKNIDRGVLAACMHGNESLVRALVPIFMRASAAEKLSETYYMRNFMVSTELNWFLYVSCASGCENIVRYLIDCGANDFNSGLYYACKGGHKSIVRLLEFCGAVVCMNCGDHKFFQN